MKSKKEFVKKNKYTIILIITIMLSFIIYGLNIFNDNIWLDEAYQMVTNRCSFQKIIDIISKDTAPPLYSILLKIFTSIFGNNLSIARLLSLIIFDFQFYLALFPIRKLWNNKASFIYIILILLSQIGFFASIEIRNYSLSMTCLLSAIIYGLLYNKNNNIRHLIFYIIFSILSLYSHNYCIIGILILSNLLLLFSKKKKQFLLSNILILISFIPWLKILKSQATSLAQKFWIEKPTFETLTNSIHYILTNNTIINIVLILILLFGITKLIKKHKDKNILIVSLTFVGTIIFFILISIYKTPMFIPKYIVPLSGLLYLSFAVILSETNKKIVILFLILLLPTFITTYQNEKIINSNKELIEMKNWTKKNLNKEKVFIVTDESSLFLSEYYFPESKHIKLTDYNQYIKSDSMFKYPPTSNQKINYNTIILMNPLTSKVDYLESIGYYIYEYKKFNIKYNDGIAFLIMKKDYRE